MKHYTITSSNHNYKLETDSLVADSVTHLVTELRDNLGRSVGYTYAKNGSVQQTVSTGFGSDGRISTAGFVHGGAVKQFNYAYMNGTHLLHTLTIPNNMSLTQSFEEKRDLLTQIDYKRGNTLVCRRAYTYDTLGRPLTRQTSRNGQTVNDAFGYNARSEVTSATVNGEDFAYNFDNICNRNTATELEELTTYNPNAVNQYTAIDDFTPTFDAAGNQTLVKTATGIWSVTYNAENRPVIFQKITDSGTTRIMCTYDYMGRRVTKKVEVITTDAVGNKITTLISNHRFIYRGYLQIGCCDLTRANHPCLWLITWDPTQSIATRPLAIQKDGNWFCYSWDLTKNICEIFGPSGYIRTAYTYTPFGAVTASGDVSQPIQWSSEYHDSELSLVYYNYRHYNPTDGRWINRDPIAEQGGWNLYGFEIVDYLGLIGDYKPALFDDLEGAQKALKNIAVPALLRKLNKLVNEAINNLYKKIDAGENVTGKRLYTPNTFEIGGWIFRTKINNKYVYDINVQDGDFEEFRLDANGLTLPKQGYCRVAIWHAHPIGLITESIKKFKTDKKDNKGRPIRIYELVNSKIKGLIDDDSISDNDKRAAFGFAFKQDGKIIKVIQESTKYANPFKLPSFILTGKEYSYKTVYRISLVKNIDLNNYFNVKDFDLYLLSRIYEKPMNSSQAILRIYKNGTYHGRRSIINVPVD